MRKSPLRDNPVWRWLSEHPTYCLIAVGILLVALLPRAIAIPYYKHVLILVMLFTALASCWNLMGGYTGLLALGNVAFFGLGAYTSTILFLNLGVSPWIGMAIGALLAAIAGIIIGYPTVRLKGAFFALGTMAFSEVLRIIALAWLDLTQGSKGLAVSYKPGFENMMWPGKDPWYYLALIYVVMVVGSVWLIRRSRLGYYCIAVREDESAARMLGIDTTRVKLYVTTIAAAFTAAGGSFYAQYMTYIDPFSVFDPILSVQFALITIAGGPATIFGPLLGALVMVPLSEFLQSTLAGTARGLHLVAYGVMLILVVMLLPNGAYPAVEAQVRRLTRFRKAPTPSTAPLREESQVDVA